MSRFFDRITRPEQLLTSLPQAMRVLTDPVECGPVTLAMPQDVQTMAFDYPEHFFDEKIHRLRRQPSDADEMSAALELIKKARKPLLIAGGGAHYSGALTELDAFVSRFGVPVGETQAGKGALPWDHRQNMGTMGVTGAASTNALAAEADLIIAVGTRLGDFATGSRSMINPDARLLSINVASFDAIKHKGQALVGDAKLTLDTLNTALDNWAVDTAWKEKAESLRLQWHAVVDAATADKGGELPSDAEVVGAVNRNAAERDIVVCAAGGLPGDLQKLWRTRYDRGYHMEYGYSCMGYELAGGLGTKMAAPDSEVYVMVGDGSYLMLNSEIATSVMLGKKLIIVLLDNRGYGCIHRLQQFCGGPGFNNMLEDCLTVEGGAPKTDFAAHAASLGARSETVKTIAELEQALVRARASDITYLVSIDTDPAVVTEDGGHWWDVAVPEISPRQQVREARVNYEQRKSIQFEGL